YRQVPRSGYLISSYSLGSNCKVSINIFASIDPGLNKNWWVGMANRGFVSSQTSGIRKSLMFWLAMRMAESFLRTRFIAFRIYSIVVLLAVPFAFLVVVKKRYSSSIAAAVLPLPSSWLLINDRMLNSIASLSRRFVSIKPF